MSAGRIAATFAKARAENRAALVTFVMAGDPDHETAAKILNGLPDAGADLVELGMPFSDPMADGPAIQAAGLRALKNGATLKRTLDLVRGFRAIHAATPLILMGYCNPIFAYGAEAFARDVAAAGADGVILVDLPPEEDGDFRVLAKRAGLAVIRLATPTTDAARLARVLDGAEGFLYYVAVAGVTGTKSADISALAKALAACRQATQLPVAAGFGIRTPEQAAAVAKHADGVVVGSALIALIAANLDAAGREGAQMLPDVFGLARRLAAALHRA